MKIQRLILMLFSLLWLQACNSISGPVHVYSGQQRHNSEIARIIVPAPITVVRIDGKEIDVPSKEEGFYDIYLLPGLHRIDFKYELAWGDNVSGMLIRSDLIGVESRLYAGRTYEITYEKPTDQDEAYELIMARDFNAELLEKETGRKVLSRSQSELDEFRLTAAYESSSRVTTPQTIEKAVPGNTTIAPPQGIDAKMASQEDAVKRLKFWWLMANDKERKQFKEWLKSVDIK